MPNNYLKSLYSKVDQAVKETNTLIDFLETNAKNLAFSQAEAEQSLEFNAYCELLSDIKKAAETPPVNNNKDIQFITTQLREMPELSANDFKLHSALPLFGIMKLRRIASLIKKLREVDVKLQAAAFSLNMNIR
ncbi:hypothetical protein [Pinibacter aurantiacus]|uniref:Uncharacterized protein n=1 Tax=Pinibacter aurantiacus TaxID=2851599 RepID=A0A9E2W991_9BACT|nr:hypothetical protein [Pinibacter aurantiacus]MBV4359731.1 hypothetical protein [Pinibacter aurantiacus]